METFQWGPKFFTHIDIVDNQHHKLIYIINQLSEPFPKVRSM